MCSLSQSNSTLPLFQDFVEEFVAGCDAGPGSAAGGGPGWRPAAGRLPVRLRGRAGPAGAGGPPAGGAGATMFPLPALTTTP